MVLFGFRMLQKVLNHILQTDIGHIPMTGGHGFHIIIGDGLRFITVVGSMIPITDMFGYRELNGVRDG